MLFFFFVECDSTTLQADFITYKNIISWMIFSIQQQTIRKKDEKEKKKREKFDDKSSVKSTYSSRSRRELKKKKKITGQEFHCRYLGHNLFNKNKK